MTNDDKYNPPVCNQVYRCMFINCLWFIEQAWETVFKPLSMKICEVIWIFNKLSLKDNVLRLLLDQYRLNKQMRLHKWFFLSNSAPMRLNGTILYRLARYLLACVPNFEHVYLIGLENSGFDVKSEKGDRRDTFDLKICFRGPPEWCSSLKHRSAWSVTTDSG